MKVRRYQATIEFDVPVSMTQPQVETFLRQAIYTKAAVSEGLTKTLFEISLRNTVFYTTDTENG